MNKKEAKNKLHFFRCYLWNTTKEQLLLKSNDKLEIAKKETRELIKYLNKELKKYQNSDSKFDNTFCVSMTFNAIINCKNFLNKIDEITSLKQETAIN